MDPIKSKDDLTKCPCCKENLQPSNNPNTDYICPCCLREFEVMDGKMYCTI